MAERSVSATGHEREKRFQFFLIVFRVCGIPILFNKVPTLFKLYSTLAAFCCYITFVALVADMFMNTEGLEHTMETVRAVAPAGMIVWIHVFLRFRHDKIGRLINFTDSFKWEEMPIIDSETGSLTTAGWIPRVQLIAKRIIQFVIVFHSSYTAVRMAMLANRPLSYNGWYPFDVSVSPTYELVNFTQLLGALTYNCTIFGFSALYATFICIACSQLEKLRTSLLDIRQNRDISKDSGAQTDQEEEGKVNASGEMFQRMQKQLNDCVRHHQQILSYIRVLEETTNPVMAGNFLLSLVCMCFASFSIVTSWGNYIQMSQGVLSFGAVLTALFIYSWFANELTDQAERIKDAAWGCDWVGTPVSFQKCIRIIISSANKKITLSAGKVVPVAISTMVNMINQSLSYFMFLLEMKNMIEHSEDN